MLRPLYRWERALVHTGY